MHKFLVIETFFNKPIQNLYWLILPSFSENSFYRSVRSFNAFFYSMRSPKVNVTEVRQFTSEPEDEAEFRKILFSNVDFNNLKTFESIWKFYEFIGYNYKTRKYKSGEIRKIWNGSFYELPKKKQ